MVDEKKANRLLDAMLRRKLNVAGEYLVGQAVMNIQSNDSIDTGMLMGSISKRVQKNSRGISLFVGTNVFYGVYIEFGSGIYAENGKGRKTSWVTPLIKIGGKWKHIRTKGSKPAPFLRPLLNLKNQVEEIISRV